MATNSPCKNVWLRMYDAISILVRVRKDALAETYAPESYQQSTMIPVQQYSNKVEPWNQLLTRNVGYRRGNRIPALHDHPTVSPVPRAGRTDPHPLLIPACGTLGTTPTTSRP